MSLFKIEEKHKYVSNQNDVIMLWVGENLPELQQLAIKSLILTNHQVNFYTYKDYPEIEKFKKYENFEHKNANDIINKKDVWVYKISEHGKGSYAGFANHWRLIYLLKYGGSWVDSDVIAITNLEKFAKNKIIIGAEWLAKGKKVDSACNGLLSFPKDDILISAMESICSKLGDSAKFAETGPSSLRKHLKMFPDYQQYLLSYRAVCPIPSFNYKHYSTLPPEEAYKENDLTVEQIFGFHIWNTRFSYHTPKGTNLTDKLNDKSLYALLKDAVLESNTQEEYYEKLKKHKIK